jgi:predicted nucleic acid-binding protein
MIVLDASAAVDWLLQTSAGQRIEKRIYSRNETLHAPHLLDLEVTQVLRRLALQRVVPVRRADEAVRDLKAFTLIANGRVHQVTCRFIVSRVPCSSSFRAGLDVSWKYSACLCA